MFPTLSLIAAPAALLLATLPGASAHALITDIRVPGPAHLAKCGQASFDEVTKDPTGHIEDQEPVLPGCELQLCRGLLFEDQAATAASTVNAVPNGVISFDLNCTIAHGGPANVALIDTTTGGTGTIIGDFLKQFDDFCPTNTGGVTPPDQANLQVTLPDAATIAGRCSKPGDCVTQLFWASPDLSQNYYYCKDTVISGGATEESPSAPVEAPVFEDPAFEDPAFGDPAFEDPAFEDPVFEDPSFEDPAFEDPAFEDPAFEDPAFEDPAFEDPAFEDPVGGAPVGEAPATEAPATVPPEQADIPTDVSDPTQGAADRGQDLVEPPAIVGDPTDIQVTDPAAETGGEDTVAIDQPTVVEGASPALETGVEDAVTPTSGANANDIDPTSLRKFIDFLESVFAETSKVQSATPVEPPVAVKRWVKEPY